MLERDSLLPTLNIVGTSLAVDLLKFAIVGIEAHTAHLLCNHIARERHNTDVVAWLGLNGNDIATLKVEVVDVLIVRASGILKSNLKDIGRYIVWIRLQPICLMLLIAALHSHSLELVTTVAETTSTSYLRGMFFITTHRKINIIDWVPRHHIYNLA